MPSKKLLREFVEILVNEELKKYNVLSGKIPEFSKLEDLKSWARENLVLIGYGATRLVYGLGPNKVLKIAGTEEYIETNKSEIHDLECLGPEYAVQPIDWDENGFWIILPRLRQIHNDTQFKELLKAKGLEEMPEEEVMSVAFPQNLTKLISGFGRINPHSWVENEWLNTLARKLRGCKLRPDDLTATNWGVDPQGNLVILDVGGMSDRLEENKIAKLKREELNGGIPEFAELFELKQWAKENLEKIGEGTSRAVYSLEDGSIIKIPHDIKFLKAQKEEIHDLKCLGPEYAIQAIDHHPKFFWVKYPLVNQVTVKEFEKILNGKGIWIKYNPKSKLMTFDVEFVDQISYLINSNKTDPPELAENKWFVELCNRLKNCKINPVDLVATNWGINNQGELVIIDVGGYGQYTPRSLKEGLGQTIMALPVEDQKEKYKAIYNQYEYWENVIRKKDDPRALALFLKKEIEKVCATQSFPLEFHIIVQGEGDEDKREPWQRYLEAFYSTFKLMDSSINLIKQDTLLILMICSGVKLPPIS